MLDPAEVLREIQRLANFRYKGQPLSDKELVNAFLINVMEAGLEATEPCLAALPDSSRAVLKNLLEDLAANDYPYVQHISRATPTPEHWEKMRPHYRQVGQLLLAKLR